jgi:hypothetical protein
MSHNDGFHSALTTRHATPYVPDREENPDPDKVAEIVIARSTQEAIVVNLPQPHAI